MEERESVRILAIRNADLVENIHDGSYFKDRFFNISGGYIKLDLYTIK